MDFLLIKLSTLHICWDKNGQNWTERYKLWFWSLSLTPCQCTAACVSITSRALWCGVFTEAAADELGTAPPLSCVLYDVFVALCHQTSSSRALQCLGRGCFNCDSYSCYLLHKTKLRMGWDRSGHTVTITSRSVLLLFSDIFFAINKSSAYPIPVKNHWLNAHNRFRHKNTARD